MREMPSSRRMRAAAWANLFLATLASAQGGATSASPAEREAEPRHTLVLEGFVLEPDGDPAPGVVVVSSAGGRAVTDAAGSYRLELVLEPDPTSVQVTAFGSAGTNTLASASVTLGAGSIRMAPLQLMQGFTCTPEWVPTFGQLPGTSPDSVEALTVFDDGSGPALYVGGGFTLAGGVAASRIAKWDGSDWSALGSGVNERVLALTVFDDGSGPALYAGGHFTSAGGVPAERVAKWDGSAWTALGGGRPNPVRALAVFDDGSGPALLAGGGILSTGGVSKWNGSAWTPTGSLMNGPVETMAVFDGGSGPELYVGGQFTTAGGVAAASRIAKWNGSSWSAVGALSLTGAVRALTVFDDGGGPALYVGGDFTNHVARWNGSSWSNLGSGISGTANPSVQVLTVFDDGGGPALYAGGSFTTAGGGPANDIAKWNGSSWTALGSGTGALGSPDVFAMAVFDGGSGSELYAGGDLFVAGGLDVLSIARWDGSSWAALGSGIYGDLLALTTFDDGGGPALYVGGDFTSAGGVSTRNIAKWDGSGWAALGSGLSGHKEFVRALTVFDDGSGPDLYAGGEFTIAGGTPASRVAKWDGSSWTALGSGLTFNAYAMTVFDDGSGPALYVGGEYNDIARWDGSSWTALGSGMTGSLASVFAMTVFDDGGGPALFAAGSFLSAGGLPANRIARWDGSSWTALGSGISGDVHALAVFDDGGGPDLYAGGSFAFAGGVSASNIARWNGSSWTALGPFGLSESVSALTTFDDGGGPDLYAGGGFSTAGGVSARRIARWNGASWSALGGGMSSGAKALAVFDDGNGPALYAGGSFQLCFDSGDCCLAKWGCPDTTAPTISCPASIVALDGFPDGPGEVVSFTVTASDELDPSPLVVCVPPSGSFFPVGTTTVTCTATDASGNASSCDFPLTVQPKAKRR